MARRRRRFTKRERTSRIYNRINKAGKKGITAKEIARTERISPSRVRHYLRQLRKDQSKQRKRIDRLGRRYYRVHPFKVQTRIEPPMPTTALWRPRTEGGEVELRGYLNYTSSPRMSRNIEIDCVMLIPNRGTEILAGSGRIKDMVEARLGRKLASMLKFGVSEATVNSANHFLFRRHGGNWLEF
jgi:hypothetical protein